MLQCTAVRLLAHCKCCNAVLPLMWEDLFIEVWKQMECHFVCLSRTFALLGDRQAVCYYELNESLGFDNQVRIYMYIYIYNFQWHMILILALILSLKDTAIMPAQKPTVWWLLSSDRSSAIMSEPSKLLASHRALNWIEEGLLSLQVGHETSKTYGSSIPLVETKMMTKKITTTAAKTTNITLQTTPPVVNRHLKGNLKEEE